MGIGSFFSPYFVVFILAAGIYMLLVSGPNLIRINHLNREGRFLRGAGAVYTIIGVIGLLIWFMQ